MATQIVMPKLGMVMTEGTIAKWSKQPNESVSQGDVIAEIETEKINYDLEATEDGIFHPIVSEGDVVQVDGLLGYLLKEGEDVPETPPPAPIETAPAPREPRSRRDRTSKSSSRSTSGTVKSTPGARRLASKLEIDISDVSPSGPGGRVVEDDVRNHTSSSPSETTSKLPPGLPETSRSVAMSGIRKSIADNMLSSISSTAQLTFMIEVDVTEAQKQRKSYSTDTGANLGMLHILIKACSETLKRHPELNTILNSGNILYFDEINIGFAVALKEGLIVPVIRQVNDKNISEISNEARELVENSKDGKVLPDSLVGATFTISVLGTVDGFTPILNTGQSAILGVGRSVEKPVVKEGEIIVREMMTVSLTVDHQVIDGAVAASFLRRFQQTVERPSSIFK